MEKRKLFKHLVASFNYLAIVVSLALSLKMKATSTNDVLDKIHEQLGMVKHIFIFIYLFLLIAYF